MPACPLCSENQAFLETENRVGGEKMAGISEIYCIPE